MCLQISWLQCMASGSGVGHRRLGRPMKDCVWKGSVSHKPSLDQFRYQRCLVIDFVILTVIDAERDALLREFGFTDHHRTQIDNRVYWKGTLSIGIDEEYSVVITKCLDAGNLDAQSA